VFVSLQHPKDTQLVNFVMHIFDHFCDFYIFVFIVNHLQLNLESFNISGLWKSVTSKSFVTPGSHLKKLISFFFKISR